MQELSDDELDNIFRNSMNSTPPFDTEAWNAMEKKLDSEKRRRAFYYRIIGLGSLLLLIGLSVVLRNHLLNTQTTTTATTTNTVQQNNAGVKDNSNVQNNPSVGPNDSAGNSSSQSRKVSSENKVKSSTVLYRSGKGSSGSNNYIARQVAVKKSNTSVKSSKDTASKLEKKESGNSNEDNYVANAASNKPHTPHTAANANDLVNAAPTHEKTNATDSIEIFDLNSRLSASDKGALELQSQDQHIETSSSSIIAQDANTGAASDETGKETISGISSATTAGSNVQRQNNSTAIDQSDTIKKDTVPASNPQAVSASASKDSIAKKQNYKQRWSINLLMNPEYSGTKEFDFYKLGFNVGLLGEYYFSPRFSLVAGAIYAKKIYSADGYDYTPAHNYWPKHAVPATVHATCGIIEIPVNIRYKFVKKQSYALFVSTGLSSYLMLKENYNYQYAVNTPGELTSTQVVNKNRYFFSIYNLSVGIEKYINNNWSVQAEPYIQLPFSGVGEGKIKLISTGMYFSVKYYIR